MDNNDFDSRQNKPHEVAPQRAKKRLYKSKSDVKVDGVCAGLAAFFGLDVTIVRLIWAVATLPMVGTSILAYIICALIIPREP